MSASTSSHSPLRIAILGGGLAGGALFHALSQHAHLETTIFEAAPAFREQGVGIGLSEGACEALSRLGLWDAYLRAGADQVGSGGCFMAVGEHAGEQLVEWRRRNYGIWYCERAPFLKEVFERKDAGKMRAGKKLVRFEREGEGDDGEITLWFEDGATHVCDVLLGADGIRSRLRDLLFGEEFRATFAGWWVLRQLVPRERAETFLGELVDKERALDWCWSGDKAWGMHVLCGNRTLVNCAVLERVPEDSIPERSQWRRSISKERLFKLLQGWHRDIGTGFAKAITETTDILEQMSMWHHMKHIPTLARGTVALMGDAAGAPTPWQGYGGGMAMEDAWILSELFAKVRDVKDAKAALLAYDHVQRPRRRRLAQSSYEVGLLVSGVSPDAGLDFEKMSEGLGPKWDWIWDHDLQKQRDEAVDFLQKRSG